MHFDWLTPDWPAPAHVHAVCTTRAGGVSLSPYDSLNLGDHVGDDAALVGQNRRIFAQALRARPVFLQQVHGSSVVRMTADTLDGTRADGCVAIDPGTACTIMVADCLPVLFTDTEGTVVAAAHAGWRGLVGTAARGVLENAVDAFRDAARASGAGADSEVLAWLGPCIGPQAFEVGSEVKQAFESTDPAAGAMFKPCTQGKWLADLAGLARLRLIALGVTGIYGNDSSAAWCTVGNPSRFFSHRRDRVSGRFAAAIWRT
ncbi:MAG: peptidoglycan editing factor PgeF [Pseudomonadota bacterium]|nr:peptidoglycan editing factor PgeF [Pseudomonadota bacterium]